MLLLVIILRTSTKAYFIYTKKFENHISNYFFITFFCFKRQQLKSIADKCSTSNYLIQSKATQEIIVFTVTQTQQIFLRTLWYWKKLFAFEYLFVISIGLLRQLSPTSGWMLNARTNTWNGEKPKNSRKWRSCFQSKA